MRHTGCGTSFEYRPRPEENIQVVSDDVISDVLCPNSLKILRLLRESQHASVHTLQLIKRTRYIYLLKRFTIRIGHCFLFHQVMNAFHGGLNTVDGSCT